MYIKLTLLNIQLSLSATDEVRSNHTEMTNFKTFIRLSQNLTNSTNKSS